MFPIKSPVTVVGGGLAGCEAALQLANAGLSVQLYEMRPGQVTPAHQSADLAELVCSNSFKGLALTSAHGLFKEELRRMGSRVLDIAANNRVAAGESLTVDRKFFSQAVTTAVENHPGIEIIRQETKTFPPPEPAIMATGPLTSLSLSQSLSQYLGQNSLSFFDSLAPVIEVDSIDYNHAYYKNRWDKGESVDFLNCPMNQDEYEQFVSALCQADSIEPRPFEKGQLFEGCLPIEEMARRGPETLRFGPMRPVGLDHPKTNVRPYAVLQLRAENSHKSLYNLVGCQTRLKYPTQKNVFSLIPALRQARFARLGAMHRNTFINSPMVLDKSLCLPGKNIWFAGQITGAEGYTEAVGTGLFAAVMCYQRLKGKQPFIFPAETCLGSLTRHLTYANPSFQPMNFNFGLLPTPEGVKKKQRKEAQTQACFRALESLCLPWN